jgi:thiamine transporter
MKDLLTLDKDVLEIAYLAIAEFVLYLLIATAVVITVVYFIVKRKKPEALETFKKITLGLVLGFALTFTAIIFYMQVARLVIKDAIDVNFYLILGAVVVLSVGAVLMYLKKPLIALATALLYAVLLLAVLPSEDGYEPLSPWGMYLSTIALVAVVAVILILLCRKQKATFNARSLAYAGICMALSYALSYIKIFSMPLGGSITLASMLPLMIFSYVFGAKKGVFVGALYGVLQCLQSPQIYHPVQVLIDYPIAFAMIGLSGAFKDVNVLKQDWLKFILGGLLAVAMRYFAHVISGYFVFYSWALYDNAFLYSVVYNAYCFIDYLLPCIVAVFLFKNKSFTSLVASVTPIEETSAE